MLWLHAHKSTHRCLFFVSLFLWWLLLLLLLPVLHSDNQCISAPELACVWSEVRVLQRTHAGYMFRGILDFSPDILPISMHESSAFICVFSLEHCWTVIWHLCPFWNQLFFQPSHLQPRTAFLFMSVRHLMSNSYALVCHLLPNNLPGLMLCNPVTLSNNSLMLPGGAKISRSDSAGLCAHSFPHKPVSFLGAGQFWSMFCVLEACTHCFQCLCSRGGTRPNVFLLEALKMTILPDLLINCLPAVTTA